MRAPGPPDPSWRPPGPPAHAVRPSSLETWETTACEQRTEVLAPWGGSGALQPLPLDWAGGPVGPGSSPSWGPQTHTELARGRNGLLGILKEDPAVPSLLSSSRARVQHNDLVLCPSVDWGCTAGHSLGARMDGGRWGDRARGPGWGERSGREGSCLPAPATRRVRGEGLTRGKPLPTTARHGSPDTASGMTPPRQGWPRLP